MNGFLPFPNLLKSSECLDWRRCGKQRVEYKQILQINLRVKKRDKECTPEFWYSIPWENHPAVLMRRGFEEFTALSGIRVCQEWSERGYEDNLYDFFYDYLRPFIPLMSDGWSPRNPDWFGDERVHESHRSKLMFKGRVDVLAEKIEKDFGQRANVVLGLHGFPMKNQLTHEQVEVLERRYPYNPKENWYSEWFGEDMDDSLPYYWPVKKEQEN